MMDLGLTMAEGGWLPDAIVRLGIRRIVQARSNQLKKLGCEAVQEAHHQFVEECRRSPVALSPEESNQQHYEVPTEFFQCVLGPHLKYSCSYWESDGITLEQAEVKALQIYQNRAQLADGQSILELGCGWGSLSLWMASRLPASTITAVSHSATQKKYIDAQAVRRGITNLKVITCDINDFSIEQKFDRIVSVEMFEHVRNHYELFRRIVGWLGDDGKLFVHIFCHQDQASPYESKGAKDWMANYFFTGGMMPSDRLFAQYQDHLRLIRQWRWSGTHYQRTSNAWLQRQDAHRSQIMPILEQVYGKKEAPRWFQRWRIFFMACAECFGYNQGNEWYISHYLFEKQQL
ncbi:MAG TPA: cyclopropane-fatty-acyl-phospholipid synthase family protein [Gemmatales bacterium]|nr:cyclopropane-fatty-acyl-phospholipid synthase family protein [Gemmatales bacterium]